MITINVRDNLSEVLKGLDLVERRVEIATQRALLQTARKVVEDERAEMARVFDSPSPWTLNSFRVALGKEALQSGVRRTVGGSSLSAEVVVKDGYWYRAENFLQYQTEGTSDRRQKAFEKALQAVGVLPAGWKVVPGERAKLDAYGNQSPGEIRQILSWFDAAERVAGSTQNTGFKNREKRRKGTRKRAGFEYYVVRPGDRRTFVRAGGKSGSHRAQPGIYRRTFLALGSQIEPVMIFIARAQYKPRFDFYGVARRTVDTEFPRAMAAAVQIELAKARP